jgi:hypothetical protein
MRLRLAISLAVGAALTASFALPSGAAAATEFGDNCEADNAVLGSRVFAIASPGPLPSAAPTAGVITSWRINLEPTPLSLTQILKVVRVNGANTVLTVGEAPGHFGGGLTSAPARIPVQAGDYLSIFGPNPPGTVYCTVPPTEATTLGVIKGAGAGVGGTSAFASGPSPGVRIGVMAVIEPDADHDGYGDETQDRCPQSAAFHDPCPVLLLDSYVLPGRSRAVVIVSSSTSTAVTVTGTAKLPKAPKKAGASAKAKLKPVTQSVAPGGLTRFSLNFPGPLKSAIRALPSGRSITVKLQASAKDVTGKTVTDEARLKIKG